MVNRVMKIGYKQHNKSKLWNQNNKVKRMMKVRSSRYVCIPEAWRDELAFGDHVLITLDSVNKRVIIQHLPNDPQLNLPGGKHDEKSDDNAESGEQSVPDRVWD
jgi:hypothetical protein